MTAAPKLWLAYQATERRLVAAGVPATSDWWLDVIERFYLHPTATRLVARVGRGGAKSWISRRTALVEMLFGDWVVPPGERHWMIHVSNRLDEARQGLAQIAAWLRILGVRHEQHDDQIELTSSPIGYWALPCTSKAARGPRSIGSRKDENASWSIEGVNPAEEIDVSLDAMAITQPRARTILASSPMSTLDYHAQQFAVGNSEHQLVVHAESWVANPGGITRDAAWKAARGDQRVFDREYRAIPQHARSAAFDTDAVTRAFTPRKPNETSRSVLILDPSSGRSDAWAFAVAHWAEDDRGPFLRFASIDGFEGSFWKQIKADDVIDRLVALCESEGITEIFGDQREAFMLESAFAKRGLSYTSIAWTNALKVQSVETVRRWLREGQLSLPKHERMQKELLAFEEKITPSGAFTFGGRGAHDDYVALLLTIAMADSQELLQRIGESGWGMAELEARRGNDAWRHEHEPAEPAYRDFGNSGF